jgi:hypothetical protein
MKIILTCLAFIWLTAGCERKLSPEELAAKEERKRCVESMVRAGGGLNSGNICDENAIRRKHGL